jgi:glycosyltransferase involved in cell wall biosynthesis
LKNSQLVNLLPIEYELPDEILDSHDRQDDFKLLVVIPAYNEARFIGSTVLKALDFSDHVLVVDDGSDDDTARVAEYAGAFVIKHPYNQGKGAALNRGLCESRRLGADCMVTLDADGQHLPAEINRLVEPIQAGRADLVIGSRYLSRQNQVPLHRLLGHKFFNIFTKLGSGIQVSDSQSGFRAFSRNAIDSLCFTSQGFSVESEMQFLAQQKNLVINEVPVTISYLDQPKRSTVVHGFIVLKGLLDLVRHHRPVFYFGILGALFLSTGMIWGLYVIKIYILSAQLAVGYTLVSLLLSLIGTIMLSTGLALHSIQGLLIDIFNSMDKGAR